MPNRAARSAAVPSPVEARSFSYSGMNAAPRSLVQGVQAGAEQQAEGVREIVEIEFRDVVVRLPCPHVAVAIAARPAPSP